MTKEELKAQFKKAIEINKYNFDVEYLNQLDLEIIYIEEEKDDRIKVSYKIHNFNFSETDENEISCQLNGFGIALYRSIFSDSDLMRKDPETARLIDLAGEEAEVIAEKRRKKNRCWFYKIFLFLESELAYMGMCHVVWHEQKKFSKTDTILIGKPHKISAQTPSLIKIMFIIFFTYNLVIISKNPLI